MPFSPSLDALSHNKVKNTKSIYSVHVITWERNLKTVKCTYEALIVIAAIAASYVTAGEINNIQSLEEVHTAS